MNRLFAKTSVCKLAAAALFTSVALLVTGCGMGSAAGPGAANNAAGSTLTGHSMGGASPITGAIVEIWAAGTSGYGSATLLAEADQKGASAHQDTDSSGNFAFTGADATYTCSLGQMIYLTSTSGNPGGVGVNAAITEVAALGRCQDLYNLVSGTTYSGYKGLPIDINEATTVAAAYALGHFATVATGNGVAANGTTATGFGLAILIGADANNSASTGSTSSAAGLYHAFENAAELVDVNGGVAQTTTPGGGTIPTALINHIANITTACVNSTGSSSAACTAFFGALTPATPTDTFSALADLALNPTLSQNSTNISNLYGVATAATSDYSPDFTATAPAGVVDFSIAVNYPSGVGVASACSTGTLGAAASTSDCNTLVCPEGVALDVNDNAYIGNSGTNACAVAPTNILSFSSNGNLLSISPNNTTIRQTLGLTVDSLGHGYYMNSSSSSGSGNIGVFAFSGGAVSTVPSTVTSGSASENFYSAVDQHNNIWFIALNGLWESAAGGASFTNVSSGAITVLPNAGNRPVGLAIDPQQNVWVSDNQTVYVLPNTGSQATPAYSNSNLITASAPTVDAASSIVFTGSSPTSYTAYISGFANDSNVGTPASGLQPYTVTLTGATVSSPTPGTNISTNIGGPNTIAADGAGIVWMADTTAKTLTQVNTGTGTALKYQPCLVVSGACTNALAVTNAVLYGVAVDSTGSIWMTTTKGSSVVQIIGDATPTWPLLSLGKVTEP